ncbi:hypothetical protein GCM10022206_82430 [Streptomyces chiangmaiensis]
MIGDLPEGTPVAFEAAFGWGRLIELFQDHGFDSHTAHRLQCKAIASARLKNDKIDAATPAHLLRSDLVAQLPGLGGIQPVQQPAIDPGQSIPQWFEAFQVPHGCCGT